MKLSPWRNAFLVSILAVSLVVPSASLRAQEFDETPVVFFSEQDGEIKTNDAIQDNPTLRRDWQKGAWGIATPEFRANAIREGKKHNNLKNAPGPKWVSIGPTGAAFEQNGSFTGHVRDSGRARTILPHPTDPNVVFFLTSGGGLWRTRNWESPNTEWTVLTDDLPTTGGGSVAFGKNPNTLYLGLGDPYDNIAVGGSMVKSRNGGNTWEPVIELGTAIAVRDVKVDTSTNRDIVLVAVDNGLFRSADEGATYSAISTFNNLSVWSIVRSSAGWLVSAQPCSLGGLRGGGVVCDGATTLYLSTDRGATWAPISNAGNVFSGGRTTLAVGLPGDSVVYAYTSTSPNDTQMKDVYRSGDGGQTWVANGVNSTKAPLNPVAGATNMNICTGQCWYNQSIAVDPTDPSRNTVYIGGTLFSAKSTNGGGSWLIQSWWLYSQFPQLAYVHADHHAALVKTTGTKTVILGNDGGLHVSTDEGTTFSSDKNNGLVSHLYYSIAGNPKFPNMVIGGLQDNGTRVRSDNSGIHNQVIGGDGLGAAYSQANTNTLVGSSQGSGIRMHLQNQPTAAFQNWVSRGALTDSAGAPFSTAVTHPTPVADPGGKVFFHFTASRVWRTNDGGLNFIMIGSATPPVSPGLPPTRRFRSSVYNLGVSPTDLNRVAVGAAGGFIDVTTNGGATWTDINLIALVPGFQGFTTNVHWQDNKTIWVAAAAMIPGALRVLKGTIANEGDSWSTATWVALQNGLPDLPVSRVYIDPRDADTIYAATHVGIYRSTDGGANWSTYGNGLPTVRVSDIYMPPDGGFIRLATYGRGIWELSQLELVNTSLTDNVSSCDVDGILDNGETGNLSVTLMNQGPNTVNHITLTVTSSNPNVTFPNGNVVAFPSAPKNTVTTGSIRVAVNGAGGVDSTDFTISVNSPELGLAGSFNLSATHRLNHDVTTGSSATESVEAANNGWTISGNTASSANIDKWQRRALSPTQHVWFGPDNNGQIDDTKPSLPDQQILTSPAMQVGSGPLSISFQHRFAFETTAPGGWDGGVIEISNNGGATWTDIGVGSYNGSTNAFTTAPIGASRPAFVNRMIGWPNFAAVTRNLGTAFAGQTVQIRFRIGADESTGAPGWDIDNIVVTGLANTPFTSLVGETAACSTVLTADATE